MRPARRRQSTWSRLSKVLCYSTHLRKPGLTVYSHRKKCAAPRRIGGIQRRLPGPDQHPYRERPRRVRLLGDREWRRGTNSIRISLGSVLCMISCLVCLACFTPNRRVGSSSSRRAGLLLRQPVELHWCTWYQAYLGILRHMTTLCGCLGTALVRLQDGCVQP